VVDYLELLDILFGENAVSLLVLLEFDDGKLLIPEADQGGAHPQLAGDLTDGEKNLFYFGFLVWHG
jgi:hypothetical protein